jgi:hypothetical protein
MNFILFTYFGDAGVLNLLGKYPPFCFLFFPVIFLDSALCFLLRLALECFSYRCLPQSWDHKYILPHPALFYFDEKFFCFLGDFLEGELGLEVRFLSTAFSAFIVMSL